MMHDFDELPDFDLAMTFGAFIRKKRRLMGMNQTDFGAELGEYTQSTISMWELGITSPPIEDARAIIKYLGGELQIVAEKGA